MDRSGGYGDGLVGGIGRREVLRRSLFGVRRRYGRGGVLGDGV